MNAVNPWSRLHAQFRALHEDEGRILQARGEGERCYLYIGGLQGGDVEGWPEQFATEDLKARFELLGTEAGIALGNPPGVVPLKHWLHSLIVDARDHLSNGAHIFTDTAGTMERLFEASMIYCARLDRQWLEESAVNAAALSEKTASESPSKENLMQTGVSPVRRGPKPNYGIALQVEKIVKEIAGDHAWRSSIEDICVALDENSVPRPKTWKQRGHRNWFDALSERHLVDKAIAHHLELAAHHGQTFS